MSRNNVDRIRYYTRKAGEFTKMPRNNRESHRFNRLIAYKKALNKRLEVMK